MAQPGRCKLFVPGRVDSPPNITNVFQVGGFNPFEKYARPIGWFCQVRVKINMFETTGHVERTVLVAWLVGKVLFHLSYEHYMGLQTNGKNNTTEFL